MNAQQLRNSILQEAYFAADGWNIKELKDVVADSCPISYGIVQQGNHIDGGVPVVRPVDLHTKYVGKVNLKCTSKDISDSYKRTVLNGNEVLLCVRGTTGIVALATEELKGCNVNRGIVPLFFGSDVDKMFIFYQLQAPFVQEAINENTMGSALKQINIKDLRTLKLRVPPLAEQKRIVAKIEELLPKVEEYGKAQDALNKLNEELPDRLKKSILQEAITGRLVPQDPNDEPASVLLDRIRKEKAKLVKEGKLKKKDLEETPIPEDEKPFEIPESWEWVRISDISESFIGLTYKPTDVSTNGWIVLRSSNIQEGILDYNDIVKVNVEVSEKLRVRVNDIIICARNGSKKLVGKSALVREVNEPTTFGAFMAICRTQFYEYIAKYLLSPLFFQQLRKDSDTTTINQLTQKNFNRYLVPLPPLAEQKRIVAKIEEVFKEIDKLKK